MRSDRRAARKVGVFQWACGTLASKGAPCGDQPRVRVMFVLARVSSRESGRSGQSTLIYLSEPALGGHVGTILLGGEQRFLKLRRASRNQAPDRDFAGDDATRGKVLRQRVHHQVLLALKPAKNPIPMRRQ